ncbi:MAG: DUF4082 domain-containing protein [Chitinophagaceae bacterium]|nr:DUF4082 domain-containing protein [Chitinophagaceae bacterium]
MRAKLSSRQNFAALRLPEFRRTVMCTLLLILFSQASLLAQTVNIFVNPASSTIGEGQSFTVAVRFDITSLTINAAEVHFDFDISKLQVTNITRPNSGQFTSETIPLPAGPYNSSNVVNTSGQINYAAGMPAGSTSTDFDLISVTFTTKAPYSPGATTLVLVNVPGRRTRAVLGATVATGSLTNGSVTLQSCTPPTATLSASAGSTTCNGQPVRLYLTNATGQAPYDLIINGSTYLSVPVSSTAAFATIPFPTYSVFSPAATPFAPQNDDGPSIEVGTKIRSSSTGFIRGIRFYNGLANPGGRYTGKLWNGTTLLASANFTGLSGIGWKEVLFTSPVQIAANTTYIASVYSEDGNYAVTDGYFTNAATNGPLTAPRDGDFGPNGLYRVGEGVPNQFYQQSNYWVDVVFASNTNTFNLTSITDDNGCSVTGALQTLNVLSVDCSTLPVTLLNFSASPGASKVTLRWTTSSEVNNRGFDVQRSDDGVNWTTIGFVAGAGNSTTAKSYTYLDQNVALKKYYYRLKQIDIDDRFRYSAIVSATLNGRPEFVLGQNYPNPVDRQTTIQFSLPQAERVNLSLFDINGRVVKVLVNGSKESGTHAINVNVDVLAKGVYYYKMQAGDFNDVKKLIVQ